MKKININSIKENPDNPRIIKDEKFKKLVQSLKDFPDMARVRPIVVNKDMITLGGNMRLRAMRDAGWTECFVQVVDWPKEQQKEFIIKDNVSFGEWQWETLANEWNSKELNDWGVDSYVYEFDKYNPELMPETTYNDITKEEIHKEAKRLAEQMIKEKYKKIECICPECGAEFQIDE